MKSRTAPLPLLPMPAAPTGLRPLAWLKEALAHHRALAVFGLVMWALMLPTLLAWGLDDRSFRGVNVWSKPLKFMASVGLFAICTAWFVGLLPEARRQRTSVRLIAWTIIVIGSLEVGYISLQALLGQASHYNYSSTLHTAIFTAMGAGALAMTATQALLAWLIVRHAGRGVPAVWRDAVATGLLLTFVLGSAAGALLGGMQAPAGAALPVVGWHLGGGDLRPAHFLGLHAQQFLPFIGWLIGTLALRHARQWLAGMTIGYIALWAWALARGLDGATLTVPPYLVLPG